MACRERRQGEGILRVGLGAGDEDSRSDFAGDSETNHLVAAAEIIGISDRSMRRWRGTLAGGRVIVCEHLDGRITINYGAHEVASFSTLEVLAKRLAAPSKRKERAA